MARSRPRRRQSIPAEFRVPDAAKAFLGVRVPLTRGELVVLREKAIAGATGVREKLEAIHQALDNRRLEQMEYDAHQWRRNTRKKQAWGKKGGQANAAVARQNDDEIKREWSDYRHKHPYSRSRHSTRVLAAHIARRLQVPFGTVRSRLATLKLR